MLAKSLTRTQSANGKPRPSTSGASGDFSTRPAPDFEIERTVERGLCGQRDNACRVPGRDYPAAPGPRPRIDAHHVRSQLRLLYPQQQNRRASILEGFATGDVVEVVVTVDQVPDRLVGDLFDFVNIRLSASWPAVSDWVGGNHSGVGDDEHRLVIDVAEDVDTVGAFNLGRLDRLSARLSRLGLSKGCPGGEQARSGDGRGKDRTTNQGIPLWLWPLS